MANKLEKSTFEISAHLTDGTTAKVLLDIDYEGKTCTIKSLFSNDGNFKFKSAMPSKIAEWKAVAVAIVDACNLAEHELSKDL